MLLHLELVYLRIKLLRRTCSADDLRSEDYKKVDHIPNVSDAVLTCSYVLFTAI